MKGELLKRYEKNPILTYRDLSTLCNAVYNPGAVKFGDQYLLLCRVEDGRRDNKLHVALSDDGYNFQLRPDPIALPIPDEDRTYEYHQYDPRITFIEGEYLIAYCTQDFQETVRIGLARTRDWETFERLPFATPPWSRNCAIFPEKIGGKYMKIERPMCGGEAITFVSESPDLVHWGNWRPVTMKPQTWMRQKWGIGPTPIKTERGWLQIIHGVWLACNYVYRIGVALLDLEDPSRVIGQCPEFILTPREEYERSGETIDCVFSNGAIVEPDGEIKVYYGAADTCVCLATGNVDELLAACGA